MCGRFAASWGPDELASAFEAEVADELPPARYNVAPTDPVTVVRERFDRDADRVRRTLETARWGLVPSWAPSPRDGARLINARAETVASKPSFARAFVSHRCLIPADGFYEWEAVANPAGGRARRQPWFFRPTAPGPLAMAGLYAFWRDTTTPNATWLTTCTIITTNATDAVGRVHDRMPMTVAAEDWAAWLDPGLHDPGAAHSLLRVPADLSGYRVSTRVNSVAHEGADLVRPVDEPEDGPEDGPQGERSMR